MKSGTSCFNWTLFRKNLTRFWPVWVLYTVIWVYAIPVNCLMVVNRYMSWMGTTPLEQVKSFANNIPDLLQFGAVLAFIFGVLAAMGTFSYLYNNRMAGMMHTLPVRREGLFLTNYLSGLSMLILPHCLVWVLTLAAEGLCSGFVDLYTVTVWWAGMSATCLFFYSFAVFCAQFTGHLLALPAFYGILNFLVIVLTGLADMLFERYLYGYYGVPSDIEQTVYWFTPVVRLVEEVRWVNPNGFGWRLLGVAELVVYAVLGLVLAGLALLVYRRRHVESAGDVVAIPVVRPIFKYGVGICTGLCIGFWVYAIFGYDALGGLTGSLLLWTAIGYFAAEMLLKKSFRVWKAWKGCAALVAVMALFVVSLQTDLFGFSSYVPALNRVVSVSVDTFGGYPYDSGRDLVFETEDRAIIEKTVALHHGFVKQHKNPDVGEGSDGDYVRLRVTYKLDNGTLVRREYGDRVWPGSEFERVARDFYCDPEIAELSYGLDLIDPEKLGNVEVSSLWNTEDKKNEYYNFAEMIPMDQRYAAVRKVYDAVLLDFAEGNLGKRYLFDLEQERQLNTCTTDLYIYWEDEQTNGHYAQNPAIMEGIYDETSYVVYHYTKSVSVTLTPNAEHTIAVLTELGILDEDTTLRLYRDIVDEENRAKLIYGDLNLNPNSATGIIGGADGPTAIVVGEPQ